MEKVVIAIPTFNNIKYTKLALASIKCSFQHEVLVIDNGSMDDTVTWLIDNNVNHIAYKENRGFSYAYNEAMDYAFSSDAFLLFAANDIVFYPNSIDHMVQALLESGFEILCGHEILNKTIVEAENANLLLEEFPYQLSFDKKEYDSLQYSAGGMNHSCIVRQKSSFDTVGYYDVNFYPAYFEDNDYARRCNLLNVKYGTVASAMFEHFWSRSIYEGGVQALNNRRFPKNKEYYVKKWGGGVGEEQYEIPFNSQGIKISSREHELKVLMGLM